MTLESSLIGNREVISCQYASAFPPSNALHFYLHQAVRKTAGSSPQFLKETSSDNPDIPCAENVRKEKMSVPSCCLKK